MMQLPETGYGKEWMRQQDRPRDNAFVRLLMKDGSIKEFCKAGAYWSCEGEHLKWEQIHGWQHHSMKEINDYRDKCCAEAQARIEAIPDTGIYVYTNGGDDSRINANE